MDKIGHIYCIDGSNGICVSIVQYNLDYPNSVSEYHSVYEILFNRICENNVFG